MKYRAGSLFAALAIASAGAALSGCADGVLGNTPSGSLPRDAHYKPTAAEVKRDPCKHDDLTACIARCQGDDAHACNMVGVMFEFSAAGNDDPALASGFYKRACDSTYAPGCNNLAWLYLGGRGVPQDHAQAMRLFYFAYDAARVACHRGEASSCLMAGELLFDGRGVEADEAQAHAYFDRACAGGEARGCERAKNPY
jgi:TPR repeat protein